MEVEYLGLGDYLVIASGVLGIEAEVLAKASNLFAGDSTPPSTRPQRPSEGSSSTPTSARRSRSSATALLATTRCPTATSGLLCWR